MEAKDIDLGNLPEGTMVKIVDKWRKENSAGMQNPFGGMDEYLGCTHLIGVKSKLGYYGIVDEDWDWYPEFFEAIKLPDSDIWHKVIEKDGKYIAIDYDTKEVSSKYYVFVAGKHSPKILHDTYEKAEQEAKRLAEKEVGCLVSICKVEKQFISKIIVEEV